MRAIRFHLTHTQDHHPALALVTPPSPRPFPRSPSEASETPPEPPRRPPYLPMRATPQGTSGGTAAAVAADRTRHCTAGALQDPQMTPLTSSVWFRLGPRPTLGPRMGWQCANTFTCGTCWRGGSELPRRRALCALAARLKRPTGGTSSTGSHSGSRTWQWIRESCMDLQIQKRNSHLVCAVPAA